MVEDARTLPDEVIATLIRAATGADPTAGRAAAAYLNDPDPRRRTLALRAVAPYGLLDETCRDALGDPEPTVRREVLTLLARGDSRSTLIDTVGERLHDEDPLVVDAACFVVGEWMVTSFSPQLEAVAREHDDARCRETAVAALGVLGEGLATVLAALEDKPPVRRRAVIALANFEGPQVEAALDRATEDRDWQVRQSVELLRREDEA
jgi:HEAT repeat protein